MPAILVVVGVALVGMVVVVIVMVGRTCNTGHAREHLPRVELLAAEERHRKSGPALLIKPQSRKPPQLLFLLVAIAIFGRICGTSVNISEGGSCLMLRKTRRANRDNTGIAWLPGVSSSS